MEDTGTLTTQEAKIYRQINGIECLKRSLEDVAELFGLTLKEVVEIEATAHRKLTEARQTDRLAIEG